MNKNDEDLIRARNEARDAKAKEEHERCITSAQKLGILICPTCGHDEQAGSLHTIYADTYRPHLDAKDDLVNMLVGLSGMHSRPSMEIPVLLLACLRCGCIRFYSVKVLLGEVTDIGQKLHVVE